MPIIFEVTVALLYLSASSVYKVSLGRCTKLCHVLFLTDHGHIRDLYSFFCPAQLLKRKGIKHCRKPENCTTCFSVAHCSDLRPSVSVVQDLDILVFAEDSCAGSLEYIVRHCVAALNLLVVNNCAATLKSHHMAAQYDGTQGKSGAQRDYLSVCVQNAPVIILFVLMLQLNKLNPWMAEYAKVVSIYAHAFQRPVLYNFRFKECCLQKLTQKSKKFLLLHLLLHCSVRYMCIKHTHTQITGIYFL